MSYEETVRQHYAKEAEKEKDQPSSTMRDLTIRRRETEALVTGLENAAAFFKRDNLRVLEIGCGNGHLLALLRERFPAFELTAVEFSAELLAIAKARNIPKARLLQGDCRSMPTLADGSFDVVFGERVLINLLNEADQKRALGELSRLLAPAGFYFMIEAFEEPYHALNEVRVELGMPAIPMPFHNLYFKESAVADMKRLGFHLHPMGTEPNFLSTHYFIARVLHEALRGKDSKIHNTLFVDFFDRALPQNVGNYGAIKFYSFQKGRANG